MFSKINWLEKAGELLVIILGILIAFWLNSWWDARNDSAREQVYLKQLKVDFEQNRTNLDFAIETEKDIKKNLSIIVQLFDHPPSEENVQKLAQTLPRVLYFSRIAPVTGTYGSLIHSGDISLLKNPELRRNLVSFASTWELVWNELQRLGDWVYTALGKPVAQEFILAQLMATSHEQQLKDPMNFKDKIDYRTLLSDRRFNKLIADLWMGNSNRLRAYEVLSADLKMVTDQLAKKK